MKDKYAEKIPLWELFEEAENDSFKHLVIQRN